jgi:hypothetical protein
MKRKMNKKLLTALLLPLMLFPMVSFAYAHWTDSVTKQIKLHAGTVEVEIVQFHIDECNSYDVSCDEEVWIVGLYPITDRTLNPHYDPDIKYELIIEKIEDADGQIIEVLITADPVYPSWRLVFKMLIHNKGRLSVRSWEHRWGWIGPEEIDPCFETAEEYPNTRNVPPHLDYREELRLHDYNAHPDCAGQLCTDKSHYTIVVAPTTYELKPCQSVLLYEEITFNAQEEPLRSEAMCHWFRLAKQMVFAQKVGETWSSVGEQQQGESGKGTP